MTSNTGHGHVFPRGDGVKARCGGPALCPACAIEMAQNDKPDHRNAKPGESDKDKALEIVSAWLQSRRTMMDGVQLGVAMDLVSFALSKNAAPVAVAAEIDDLHVRLVAAETNVSHLSVLADRWCAVRDVPNDQLGAAGIPCIALPSGLKSGDYLNGQDADDAVDHILLTHATPAALPGYKLVPIEPTSNMLDAGCEQHECEQGDPWYSAPQLSENDCADIYRAMLNAAPEVKS